MTAGDPKTLEEATEYFAEFENCRRYLSELRWPDHVVRCPRCQSQQVVWLEKPRVWKCYGKHPQAKFSPKTGTIWEDSPLAVGTWLTAIWMVVNCGSRQSSRELARYLGLTPKTAWIMEHRIRLALNR